MEPLQKVRRAAAKAALAHEGLEAAMREAHERGESLRKIAAAASVSHTQVQRILSR